MERGLFGDGTRKALYTVRNMHRLASQPYHHGGWPHNRRENAALMRRATAWQLLYNGVGVVGKSSDLPSCRLTWMSLKRKPWPLKHTLRLAALRGNFKRHKVASFHAGDDKAHLMLADGTIMGDGNTTLIFGLVFHDATSSWYFRFCGDNKHMVVCHPVLDVKFDLHVHLDLPSTRCSPTSPQHANSALTRGLRSHASPHNDCSAACSMRRWVETARRVQWRCLAVGVRKLLHFHPPLQDACFTHCDIHFDYNTHTDSKIDVDYNIAGDPSYLDLVPGYPIPNRTPWAPRYEINKAVNAIAYTQPINMYKYLL